MIYQRTNIVSNKNEGKTPPSRSNKNALPEYTILKFVMLYLWNISKIAVQVFPIKVSCPGWLLGVCMSPSIVVISERTKVQPGECLNVELY